MIGNHCATERDKSELMRVNWLVVVGVVINIQNKRTLIIGTTIIIYLK